MERSDLNWRGVVIFGLAVLSVIVLINVIDDEPAQLGVNSAASSQDSGDTTTLPGASTTTVPGATGTTKPGSTATTKPGTTTTTSFNPAGRATLTIGSSGTDVLLVQQTLTKLGLYSGPLDSSYGPSTAAAVTTFQTQKGLSPADGQVGPATWNALAAA
ncbi:MAG TPA: peptidoglycan-binding domain-containing protein [Acidimicrobiia bacterium]|nr:peptidoglycan-binding domain-containing protein [Acidimicrobiia bacterium]